MIDILQDDSPEAIPPAIEANKLAFGAYLSTLPGGRFHDEPGIAWFETGLPLDLLNGVLRTDLERDALPGAIERVLAHFERQRLPFQWRIGPSSQPRDVGDVLQARGIVHVEDEPGMAVDLSALREDLPLATALTKGSGAQAPDFWHGDSAASFACATLYLAVASGVLFGPCRCHSGGLGRAGPSRKADPVEQVSTPPPMLSPAGRENPLPSGKGSVNISPVTTDEQLEAWMRVWGCGAPAEVIALRLAAYRGLHLGPQSPLRLYLGTLGGEPVATAALFYGGGVAAVEDVVTLPSVRRQGVGATMTLAAAREASAQGYRVAVLSASPMGITIYRRLGFHEYCTLSTYQWRPAELQDAQDVVVSS